jgi:hemerythrin-like domain-containing protein
VNQTMRILRCEHRSIEFLLDILERQTDLIENSGEPNLPLIAEIIDYFRSFPDMHHHPKEDLVLRRLCERAKNLYTDFFGLEDEHDHLSNELHAFSRTVSALMIDPCQVTRTAFILTARSFIECERQHMAKEERDFFPAAEHWLTDEDWAEIDEVVKHFVDPMSAPDAAYSFCHLTEHLDRLRNTEAA